MKSRFEFLLARVADNALPGNQAPVYPFMPIAIVSAAPHPLICAGRRRGFDRGPGSAGGGRSFRYLFALWGSAQLVYAFIQLAVTFRYRSLDPLHDSAKVNPSLKPDFRDHQIGHLAIPLIRQVVESQAERLCGVWRHGAAARAHYRG